MPPVSRLLFSLITGLILALQSTAPPPLPTGSPAALGFDPARLQAAADLYREAVEHGDVKGAVLYVARRGQVVTHEALGWRHEAYALPMEKDTLFRMASNTKPLIAASVLMLAEEGRLALADPVAKYLASFDNDKSRAITIEQLLSHTSGFRVDVIMYPFARGEEASLQAAVAKFGAEGPTAPPGTYSYSNAGFNTLGAVIEVVSGLPLERFLQTRLYEPLGMSDSLNHEDPAKLARMATVYRGRRGSDGRVTFTQGFTPGDPPDFPVVRASGGLISTAADYARFLEMFRLDGVYGGRRLLRAASVKNATTPRVASGPETSYGLGWMIHADGSYMHTGSDGTMGWVDPAREIVGLVLTQSPGGNNPTGTFRALVNDALIRPR
jgi:CubicO group peptidase (beta-lactamase class C family)